MYRVKRGIYMSTGFKRGAWASLFLTATLWGFVPLGAESGFDPFEKLRINPESDRRIEKIEYRLPLGVIIVNANSILQAKSPSNNPELAARFLMQVTAYSSSVDETDSTPHVTASGTRTRDGVIASNAFPIGTQLRIPELFGEKILIVEDRMHQRFTDRIDIWMPSKWQALRFGKQQAEVEIIEL